MTELNYTPVPNKIRVCHFPQVPCKPFIVEVENEREAYLVEQALANQHLWLYDNDFIPDYCNAITVDMWDENETKEYFAYKNLKFDSEDTFKNYVKKNPELKNQNWNKLKQDCLVTEQGNWVDYWNESECMEWDEFKETYFKNNNGNN